MTRAAWRADRPTRCEVCGGRGRKRAHHVVYAQTVRREGGDLYAIANRLWVCDPCHERHHGRSRVIALSKLPDSAFEFAAELLGPGRAYNDLRRHYAGEDPRLQALLAAA